MATAIIVIDVLAQWGIPESAIAPVGFLAAQLLALVWVFLRPRARTAVIFIAVSAICIAGYQLTLLTAAPSIADPSPFLVNRPVMVICAIGAVTGTTRGGIIWTTAALLLGESASIAVHVGLGHALRPGLGPVLVWVLIVILMLWLRRSRAIQAERVPDAAALDRETQRLQHESDAEDRAAAVIHDTVLSDLAAIVHGLAMLPDHHRRHLRENVGRLRAAMSGEAETAASASASIDLDLLGVVSDLQWKGLTVDLSGSDSALTQLTKHGRSAALNAIRAALENVLLHSGTASADLFIDDNAHQVMIMVVDQGVGFDPDAVGSDRLGVRLSIIKRVEDCAGSATVWSELGVGTSLLLTLPKAEGGGRGGE